MGTPEMKLAFALVHAVAATEISVSRTINKVTVGTGKLVVDGSDCASSDEYGSNDCKLQFGKTYAIHASVAQSVDITKGATVTGNFHIEKIVPFKFSCPACGATCSIKVPVIGKDISLDLPDCPISGYWVQDNFTVTLPDSSPLPAGISLAGKLSAVDGAGATILDADVSVASTSSAPLPMFALDEVEKQAMLSAALTALVTLIEAGAGQLAKLFGAAEATGNTA